MWMKIFTPVMLIFVGTLLIKFMLVFLNIKHQMSSLSAEGEGIFVIKDHKVDSSSLPAAVDQEKEIDNSEAKEAGNVEVYNYSGDSSKGFSKEVLEKDVAEDAFGLKERFLQDHQDVKIFSLEEIGSNNFSKAELEVLTTLDKREQELKLLEKNLFLSKKLLQDNILKVEKKSNQVKNLIEKFELLIKAYENQEDQKINRLVKIYENMPPKDVAKIFNELDVKDIIPLVRNMKESKLGPIFSNMNSVKAKNVSIEYMKNKSVQTLMQE